MKMTVETGIDHDELDRYVEDCAREARTVEEDVGMTEILEASGTLMSQGFQLYLKSGNPIFMTKAVALHVALYAREGVDLS